ncbi:lysophospholipid acyltransferase family protein [Amnibacterium kyonggiense]|uniref:1-acyl-sn-glycerol-3-phosphate acyltransferase n=1 Tax=Amnibacterium kyonggiense TaxID=595671 RepID=A0A4R7FSV8_9MICO|nr:lysophospholipid acyltransferase family protein [Amnibacterium kyonggiense]TDS80858.1 1-acyl-sn-glycerol-3-phosphate acyltransferase [Amnibacterium kyonggiense]
MSDREPVEPALAAVRTTPRRPKSEKRRPSVWWPLAGPAAPIVRALAATRIRSGEKLPATGPYILTPNHMSNLDPVVVGEVVWRLGRAPRFLAKASLFRVPVLGGLLHALGQIPVDRGGAARGAIPLSAAERLIGEGQGVIVYPEGSLTRDPDLWPMRGKTGAARLALQLGIPVIPVAHWGAQALMPVNSTKLRLRPRAHVQVLFGDPIDLSDLGRVADKAALAEATDRIMAAITELLEELRGETAPAERWDPAKHGQTETGTF